eukprot:14224507-Alexandrium_andersonii.AAC.1
MLERALRAVAGRSLSADSPGGPRRQDVPEREAALLGQRAREHESPRLLAAEGPEDVQPRPVLREAAVDVGIE